MSSKPAAAEPIGLDHPAMTPDLAERLLPRSMFPIRFALAVKIGQLASGRLVQSLPLDSAVRLLLAELRAVAAQLDQHLNVALLEAQRDPTSLSPRVRQLLVLAAQKAAGKSAAEKATTPSRPSSRRRKPAVTPR